MAILILEIPAKHQDSAWQLLALVGIGKIYEQ
jgi:hypothetical protein